MVRTFAKETESDHNLKGPGTESWGAGAGVGAGAGGLGEFLCAVRVTLVSNIT